MRSILVVEDDQALNRMICAKLMKENYQAFSAFDGNEALAVMDREHIDLIISDVMMPNMDGITLTKELRRANYHLPILMITAKSQMEDMEKGFVAGTDDYMIKPINLREMLLRVGALLRRAKLINEKQLTISGTVLDYGELTVKSDGNTEHLPSKEFYLLFKLLNQPNKIFTRQELLDDIWGMDKDTDGRNVDAHVKKLRKRFADNSDFEIMTVRGLGYKAVFKEGGHP
ncbi:MAG: response regulator transcription factor [Anaerovibrio sp.]|uniref:response regulator transcription factor n=1 Tax=Anaerovibrio sp. TaxID=1872532 RepID=UPI0025F95C1A|nr:response regulator transcription factor [Anaerovibrio sp.]MCR5176030.1 response regulator transcription factor [Anaerovibrio sp.]